MDCWGAAHRGDKSTNWRGGRVTHTAHGYVLIRRPPGHPNRSAYVREHIFVMEKKLGRYLLPGENVHHKNGVRDDNRIANLELWVKSQPAGQRVKDLVAWAHEILGRYEP